MKKVNFIPKTDIDEYLNDCYNIEIFNFLTENDLFCEEPEPLEFLNLFYEQLEIINANKEKPIAVIKHLLGLKLDRIKRYYLLYCLENYIIKCSNIAYEDNETYFKLKTCVNFIEKERKKLKAKLHTIPDGFENTLEQYLKQLDLFKKNEPEKYEDFKEITDRVKEIALRKIIEGIEFLFEKSKTDYSGLTVSIARKEIFIREQLEKYEKANLRFKKFGDYANDTFNKYQPIFTEALEYWKAELDNLKPFVTALPPQPIVKQKPIKYGAKEYALTYIFDLYAIGKQVPINRIEGSFDAKKIKQDASKFPMYDKAPDTFYRAVKSVLEYDLNKPTDLKNISKDWLNAVRNLSTNWAITEQYLKGKKLIGE